MNEMPPRARYTHPLIHRNMEAKKPGMVGVKRLVTADDDDGLRSLPQKGKEPQSHSRQEGRGRPTCDNYFGYPHLLL